MGRDAVGLLVEQSRRVAACEGELLSLVHEVACAATVPEFATMEVAAALTWTRFAAEAHVALAQELCSRLPDVHTALCCGDIDLPKAKVFADILSVLDTDLARTIAAAVLPKAPSRTTGQLRDILRRKALSADPQFTKTRRERAASLRAVHLTADNAGNACLSAFGLDAPRARAAFNRITAIAKARKYSGNIGRLEQLRADVFLELLEGNHTTAPGGTIHLTVSLETLAGYAHDPATLAGFGPVAADIARQWTAQHPGYQWQYGVHDTVTGELLQQGLVRARPTTSDTPTATPPGTSRHSRTPATPDTAPSNPGTNAASSGADAAPSSTEVAASSTSSTGQLRRDRRDRTPTRNARYAAPMGSRPGSRIGQPDRNPASPLQPQSNPQTAPASPTSAPLRGNAALPQPAPSSLARPPAQDPRDRFANAALKRWIRLRDKTCRAPGCRAPATQCDLDHCIRYADGGPTSHDDLCCLCRYHHRSKDEGGWTLIQYQPGYFLWISPLKQIYTIGPEPP